MPAESEAKEQEDGLANNMDRAAVNGSVADAEDNGSSDGQEDDDEEDEPRLKYTRLTASLSSAYRNGDATSSFLIAGDKMVLGTHNGNIHVFASPSLQSLRLYHAHSASVTAVSISPIAATPPANSPATRSGSEAGQATKPPSVKPGTPASAKPARQQPSVPNIPSNQIYIASASIDGHVCVSSLVDPNDVMLRNFARPVQAVALSPDFKNDRTYLSGGLAGSLILTVGGKAGVSSDASTNGAAAAASGWLGSIGLGSNTGRDSVLHSGEGSISTIKFSKTNKYVVWINEHGIKIMRSHLKLESADADSAWKRIAHIDRPGRGNWEDMANVWKARADWVSEKSLESDEDAAPGANGGDNLAVSKSSSTPQKKRPEKLVVGWGDTAWVIHVQPGGAGVGKHVGERTVGSADIVHKLTFDDCVVSGLSLYTPSLLAVLAYRTRDDNDKPVPSSIQGTSRRNRQNGLSPELRLISVVSGEEIDVDTLEVSRYESLSAADYHLGTLYVPAPQNLEPTQRGALESLGAGFWDVGSNATRLFSSGATVTGSTYSGENGRASLLPPQSTVGNARLSPQFRPSSESTPSVSSAGLKIFIHSPYDCVLAIKRDLSDHWNWLIERQRYGSAWELLDEHPSIVQPATDRQSIDSSPSTPTQAHGSLADFFADDSASQTTASASRAQNPATIKEKRRIGDLWIQQLVKADDWEAAGKVAGKVLGTSTRWEYWVLAFAEADHFDEITPYIPSTDMKPQLPSFVYEVVLGHYISHDRPRFQDLLEQWDPEMFDITSVTTAIDSKLESGDVTEDTTEDGEQGRDWRILLNGLAKLKLAGGSAREALRCYIRLQNSDAAMALIRDYHLVDAIADDIPGLLLLRVSKEQLQAGNTKDLEEASSEAVKLLVDEAYAGVVQPQTVVDQLERKGNQYHPFLYFYLASLWRGPVLDTDRLIGKVERLNHERRISEGQSVVEQFADLALSIFAEYDRDLLMTFLRHSTAYNLGDASNICEKRQYIPELVYLLSKTGQTRRALFLIIGKLGDVSQAIGFAKEHPDLWDDLLDYSMDKPPFIRALLAEVGTSIDPIQLIRRIPDGLEIEGLKEGIQRMVREYDIQYSISDGVAKVFRGEVQSSMDMLRAGQKRAVKFEVRHRRGDEVEVKVDPVASKLPSQTEQKTGLSRDKVVREKGKKYETGHCVGCEDLFDEDEHDFLVGFACGHVFHLSCLLDYIKASRADYALVETLQAQAGSPDSVAELTTRSVGAKIAHAQVIRSAIKGGCPVCVTAKGAE